MIDRIQIQDFKAHLVTKVELSRFTMLVGENASGKSSVLDALWLQSSFSADAGPVLHEQWALDDLRRRGATGPIVIASEGALGRQAWQARLSFEKSSTSSGDWRLDIQGLTDGKPHFATQAQLHPPMPAGNWDWLRDRVGRSEVYRFSANKIAAAAYDEAMTPWIRADGTNTAAVLAALKLGNDEAFQRIEDAMRMLIPSVKRIRIRSAPVRFPTLSSGTVNGNKLYFDFVGADGVPAHNASHGTLIVLALLSVLLGDTRPSMILLDDFDHALHPRAQIELVRLLKKLLALSELKDVQIVATTHSPYVLDEMEASEVQAFALRSDGVAVSKRLSDHPHAARSQGSLSAGQLWSLDPERDWVLGDRAA
jgi:predicted ATPase